MSQYALSRYAFHFLAATILNQQEAQAAAGRGDTDHPLSRPYSKAELPFQLMA